MGVRLVRRQLSPLVGLLVPIPRHPFVSKVPPVLGRHRRLLFLPQPMFYAIISPTTHELSLATATIKKGAVKNKGIDMTQHYLATCNRHHHRATTFTAGERVNSQRWGSYHPLNTLGTMCISAFGCIVAQLFTVRIPQRDIRHTTGAMSNSLPPHLTFPQPLLLWLAGGSYNPAPARHEGRHEPVSSTAIMAEGQRWWVEVGVV